MVKCGFCHVLGHNRRGCDEIRKLGLKGIAVPHDAIIEDFQDILDEKDSDFEPERSSDSEVGDDVPTQVQPDSEVEPQEQTPAPSDNPLNVAADARRVSSSPVNPQSLDELLEEAVVFDTINSNLEVSPSLSLHTPSPAEVRASLPLSVGRSSQNSVSGTAHRPPYVPPHLRGIALARPPIRSPARTDYPQLTMQPVPRLPRTPVRPQVSLLPRARVGPTFSPASILRNYRPNTRRRITAVRRNPLVERAATMISEDFNPHHSTHAAVS